MDTKEINKRISEVNPNRLEVYQKMFDRILLYNLAANVMPQKEIDRAIKWVDRIVKKTIDVDSENRTNYLQSTKEGRLARISEEPDGEDLRLEFLKTWAIAKDIITSNLKSQSDEDEDDYELDYDD